MDIFTNQYAVASTSWLSVQVEDHSAFCRSEASILFQLIRFTSRINSYTNGGRKENYNNHIITVSINDKSVTADVYFSLFLIDISLPSPCIYSFPRTSKPLHFIYHISIPVPGNTRFPPHFEFPSHHFPPVHLSLS